MKYLKTYNIFEKSSLTALTVPEDIMKEIQTEFELNSNVNWELMKLKKNIITSLKQDKSFFLSFSKATENIFIFFKDNNQYYIQYFKYDNNGWGSYQINNREEITATQLNNHINIKNTIYKLNGDFKSKTKKQRRVQAQSDKLKKTTEDFKYYILGHFNNIVKRMYGNKYYRVMKKISENLSKVKQDTNANELFDILIDNTELAKIAAEYENSMNDDDLFKLRNLEKKYNSLSTLDEYLISFEEEYSEKYNYYLNIKDLINDFGRMQIETAFMYFLYTGKIKELRSTVNESYNKIKTKHIKSIFEFNTEYDDHKVNQGVNINNMRPTIDLPSDYFITPDEDGDDDDEYYSTSAGRDGLYHGTEPGYNKGIKAKNTSVYKMSAESYSKYVKQKYSNKFKI